jgi:hypothetical protein
LLVEFSTLRSDSVTPGFLSSGMRLDHERDLTMRSSQPLAGLMFSFHMISTLNSVAKLAAASGG